MGFVRDSENRRVMCDKAEWPDGDINCVNGDETISEEFPLIGELQGPFPVREVTDLAKSCSVRKLELTPASSADVAEWSVAGIGGV